MIARRAFRAIARLALFILIFSLEIRVRAAIEEPALCWKSAEGGACAVRTAPGERLELALGSGRLVLDGSTTLVRVKKGELKLLSGQVWARVDAPLTVGSEFGKLSIDHGEFWVSRARDRVTGSAVSGVLKMSPRGGGEELEIPPGLENWLGKVQLGTRRAHTGVPMAIPFGQHLSRWARLYTGGRAQFAKEAEAFHETWRQATAEAAGLHQELHARKMASIKEQQSKEAAARRKVEARNRELIEMFKRKVFDP